MEEQIANLKKVIEITYRLDNQQEVVKTVDVNDIDQHLKSYLDAETIN